LLGWFVRLDDLVGKEEEEGGGQLFRGRHRGVKGFTKQENIVIQVKCLTVQRQRANTEVNEIYEIVIEAPAGSLGKGRPRVLN